MILFPMQLPHPNITDQLYSKPSESQNIIKLARYSDSMSRQQLDDLIQPDHSSEEEDNAESSINNLNKQLKQFQHRFKGYYVQKPFSDSDSEDDVKPASHQIKQSPPRNLVKEEPNRVAQVKDQIKWKDSEIEQLLKLEGDGPKDKKIKQLAQKVKLLSITLQKERNSKKKEEMQGTKLSNTSVQNELKKSIKPNEDADLKSKLMQSEKQVMELRLKSQNLKNELNKAMRVISKEIGEQVNIDELLSQQNAWKGRQQKIEHLKGKVKQLESKLSSNGVNISYMSGFTMQSNDKSTKQQTTINNLSENRRKQMQNLKVQVQAVKSENEILQGKVKALASRKGTLETELKDMRTEFEKKEKLLKEKSDNDDKYISLMKGELEKLKKEKEEKVVTKLVYKNSTENASQTGQLKKQLEKARATLAKKEEDIRALQQQLSKSKQQPGSRQARPRSNDKTQKVIQKKVEELQRKYFDQQGDQSLTPEEEEAIYKQWKEAKLKGTKS